MASGGQVVSKISNRPKNYRIGARRKQREVLDKQEDATSNDVVNNWKIKKAQTGHH